MSQTTFYSKNYAPTWPPTPLRVAAAALTNPDSRYWHDQAQAAIDRLDKTILDPQAWNRWIQLYQAAGPESMTWREIWQVHEVAATAYSPEISIEAVAYVAGILGDA
jgi:hypothetical protein